MGGKSKKVKIKKMEGCHEQGRRRRRRLVAR
jgi:hypothetical protein